MNIFERIIETLRHVDKEQTKKRVRVKKAAMAVKETHSARDVMGQVDSLLEKAGIGGQVYYDEVDMDFAADEAKDINEEQRERKYRDAVTADRVKNIKEALRAAVKFRKQSKLLEEVILLLEAQKKTKVIIDKLIEVKKSLMDITMNFQKLHEKNVDSHYIYHRLILKELQGASDKDIIPTPSVSEVMKTIHRMIASGETGLLGGPTGAGKTRMIEAVALEAMQNRIEKVEKDKNKSEEEKKREIAKIEKNGHWRIVSGRKEISDAVVYGQEGVRVKPPDDYVTVQGKIESDIELFRERYVKEHNGEEPKKRLVERKRAEREEYYAKQQTGGIETEFVLGQLYEAMEAGIPFVLDEVNAIPPDVLVGLNELMEARPGQTVRVQGNGKTIKIKEGFCIIGTGNFGEAYTGRFAIDETFRNRFHHKINVDYLQNTTEIQKELTDETMGNELFMVLISKWMGKNKEIKVGGLVFPDTIDSLFDFSKFVRLVQDISSGKRKDLTFEEDGPGGAKVKKEVWKYLKKPIGMREVLSIVEDYLENMSDFKPLEYYIIKHLFDVPETEGGDKDKVIRAMYYELLRQYGFFKRFAEYDVLEKEAVKIEASGHSIDFRIDIKAVERYFSSFALKSNQNFPGKPKKLFGEDLVRKLFGEPSKERDYEALAKTIKFSDDEQASYDRQRLEEIKAENSAIVLNAKEQLLLLQEKVKAAIASQ